MNKEKNIKVIKFITFYKFLITVTKSKKQEILTVRLEAYDFSRGRFTTYSFQAVKVLFVVPDEQRIAIVEVIIVKID